RCAILSLLLILLPPISTLFPYTTLFRSVTVGGVVLTGMDIELVKSLSSQIGVESRYEQVDWKDHQQDLFLGKRDMAAGATYTKRSEEHTSELQSRENLVCRLLLEKKKKK